MHHWNGFDDLPADLGACVVTLGNFDGVHLGHKAVLARAMDEASTLNLPVVAVTFEPHPIAVLRPDQAPELLTSLAQKLDLLATTGLYAALVLPFTREFAAQTPEEFVRTTLVDALHAKVVVVGVDTRFGVRNSGNVDTLRDLATRYGFTVVAVDDVGEHGRWSSTQIRELTQGGDVAMAAKVLGRPHVVRGVVVHGDHRGRGLGFPTANLSAQLEGLIPADGVYAGWLVRQNLPAVAPDRTLPAAISIGTNPTFDGEQRRVEAYVLDRDDLDLYGELVSVEFVDRLRPTLRFDSVEDLVVQMHDDVRRCREILATLVPS